MPNSTRSNRIFTKSYTPTLRPFNQRERHTQVSDAWPHRIRFVFYHYCGVRLLERKQFCMPFIYNGEPRKSNVIDVRLTALILVSSPAEYMYQTLQRWSSICYWTAVMANHQRSKNSSRSKPETNARDQIFVHLLLYPSFRRPDDKLSSLRRKILFSPNNFFTAKRPSQSPHKTRGGLRG